MNDDPKRDQPAKESAKPLSTHLARLKETIQTTQTLPRTETASTALSTETSSRFRLRTATNAEILRHLADLDVIFPSPQMTTLEKSRRYQIFCAELAPYPEAVIAMAKQQYIRDVASVFYPSPGQLIALCEANAWEAEHKPGHARPASNWPPPPHPNVGKRIEADDPEMREIIEAKPEPQEGMTPRGAIGEARRALPADVVDLLNRKRPA